MRVHEIKDDAFSGLTPKDRYRKLCSSEPSIPIFSQAWWLDAVSGPSGWDVALVEGADRQIMASLPYIRKRILGLILLGVPPLTQALGPWVRATRKKYSLSLAREKDLLQALIQKLPSSHVYAQNWHWSQKNWLPFYWEGFQQTTRYTYRLTDLTDEQKLWDGLQENIRTDIRKAKNRFSLHVRTDLSIEDFLTLNVQTFERQGMRLPYSKELVRKLDEACIAKNARKIFIAEDSSGKCHAGVYIVWDQNSAYYLMGGGDPVLRRSGATSLCMWEAIRFSSTVTKSFDFEGSMIEPIERFFRGFGAEQTPYFYITKNPFITKRTIRIAKLIYRSIKKY